jgi:TonB family protein
VNRRRLTATLAGSMLTHAALLLVVAVALPRSSVLPSLMVELAAGTPASTDQAAASVPATSIRSGGERVLAPGSAGPRSRENAIASAGSRPSAASPPSAAEPPAPPPRVDPPRVAARVEERLLRPEIAEPPAPAPTAPSASPAPPPVPTTTLPSGPVPSSPAPAAMAGLVSPPPAPPPSPGDVSSGASVAIAVPPGDGGATSGGRARPGDAGAGDGSDGAGRDSGPARGGSGGQGLSAALAPGDGGGPAGDGGREYAGYLGLIRSKIQQALQYPPVARRRSLTGTVQLEIVVEPSGAIERVSIVSSSAHPVLDEAVLTTVRGLPPIPFPPTLRPRSLRARLPIVFELQ